MRPTLIEIETLARRAGEILRAGYGRRHQVNHKGIIDLVTEIDHRSEAFLLDEIRRNYPDHQVLAEESGASAGEDCCQWYIDPLDGTVNYAHGVPIFCVSLAYQEAGKMHLGVVYDPLQDECFSAEQGVGAWLNGKELQVSMASDLNQSLLVTGFPYDVRTNPENNLDNFRRFSLLSQGVRRLGSAALDLCYVAAGRFDGFWEIRLNPWDVAAGALIAQEAGAKVTNIQGSPDYLSQPQSILAANPNLHPLMLEVLEKRPDL
ncbi:MAG TPA: inositol monophosphatase family protein [Anaerolineales bacterium]|nr:inositol monophosphatase family protein [Anaerolineales bacterium]